MDNVVVAFSNLELIKLSEFNKKKNSMDVLDEVPGIFSLK